MAVKIVRRKATGKPPSAPGTMNVKIVMDVVDETPSYYVNHIEISHSKFEFGLSMGKLPTRLPSEKLKVAKESGEIHIEPILQILVPPTLLPGLIKALTEQQKTFEGLFGKIKDLSHWADQGGH